MKKVKQLLVFFSTILLASLLCVLYIAYHSDRISSTYHFDRVCAVLFGLWLAGSLFICLHKAELPALFRQIMRIVRIVSVCGIALFAVLSLLASAYPYKGNFHIETPLFTGKNVMILIPHQDDEINLAGGLIEQYTAAGSEVTVVFTTNGDQFGKSELRAKETLSVLNDLGVRKENIYYLGFGDGWKPQTADGITANHIYNAQDPDSLWASLFGVTATYGTSTIEHYLDLPYTRNNFLHSLKSLILERCPDTIFAVDFDSHIDHRASSLLFEEAMGQILRDHPDYRPTVYKGFCYGTAWTATTDYFHSINLRSTEKPADSQWVSSGMGYRWEDRVRFPLSDTNLNIILSNNSVYDSLARYRSQKAPLHSTAVLNGDKVFWERRTDSLLYNAEIHIGGQTTTLLNDFKHIDYPDIANVGEENTGVAHIGSKTLRIDLPDTVTANVVYLYDNPAPEHNILGGLILFSDGSSVAFGNLKEDGAATPIPFPDMAIPWMEITVTDWEGDYAGLCEVELFYDEPAEMDIADTYIMPVDSSGNFVYDYVLQENDTLALRLFRYPQETPLTCADVQVSFSATGSECAYLWDGDLLVIHCTEKEECRITLSQDSLSTSFSVSNPGVLKFSWINALRHTDRISLNLESLLYCIIDRLWLALN